MKKLLRCSVVKELTVDFYVLVDHEAELSDIYKNVEKWVEGDPIEEWDDVDEELKVHLEPKERGLTDALSRIIPVMEMGEGGSFDIVDESDLDRMITDAIEEVRAAAELADFEAKQTELVLPLIG